MTNDKMFYEPIAKLYRDCPPPGICGVYSLIDPVSGETKYVGQSKDIARRYRSHLRTSNRDRSKRGRWVSSLTNQDLAPLVVVLAECGNTGELDSAEQRWQLHYANLGANLVNEKLNRKPQIVSRRVVEYSSAINSPFTRNEPEGVFNPVVRDLVQTCNATLDCDLIEEYYDEGLQEREMLDSATQKSGEHKGKILCESCRSWCDAGEMQVNTTFWAIHCEDCYDPEEGLCK